MHTLDTLSLALAICLISGVGLFAQVPPLDALDYRNETLFEPMDERSGHSGTGKVNYTSRTQSVRVVENYLYGKLNCIEIYKRDSLVNNIQYTYHERDRVIEMHDLETGDDYRTQVYPVIRYPMRAREEGREGTVRLTVDFDEDCVARGYRIVFATDADFAEAVREHYDLFIEWSDEYHIVVPNCGELEMPVSVPFSLE